MTMAEPQHRPAEAQRRAAGSPGARAARGYRQLLDCAGARGRRERGDAPVQRVKMYNHQEKLFVNDEDDDPAPRGYATVSKYFHDTTQPPWTAVPPRITEVDTGVYDSLRPYFTNVGPDRWNEPVASPGGAYTEGMSTCTTIGFRGWADGQLYTALYHNTGTDQAPADISNDILIPLHQQFGKEGLPEFGDLTNLKYFAVGGSETSQKTCASIITAFHNVLPAAWDREVKLFADREDTLPKHAMVDSAGNIVYALGD